MTTSEKCEGCGSCPQCCFCGMLDLRPSLTVDPDAMEDGDDPFFWNL
jgi:Fe-S-cluster-containing hydrogenase component 2